jgi:hypothetical protein
MVSYGITFFLAANLLALFFGKKGWPQVFGLVFRMTLTRLQKLLGRFF